MKMRLPSKGRMEVGLFASLAAAVLFVCFLSGGNPEAFLIDDNRTQWYPVMERAYEDLWETGRIYCYDLYQMKGMSIAQQGYYGIMNPFMLLSYSVTSLLPGGISAITFYIGLMVVLGNLFMYLLLRRIGCGEKLSFLMTVTYSTMGCFWAFFVWYYVFNNYFLIPLLLYAFLRCKDGPASYCAFGIILAMDLWMGNVQYTCYHYILFGILCVVMMVLKRYRYLGIFFANVAVGIVLSVPMFILLLQASGDFQKYESFLLNPIFYFSLLIHSVLPQGILQRFGRGISFLDSTVMSRSDNLVLYMGAVFFLLCVFSVRGIGGWLWRIRKCGRIRDIYEEVRDLYERMLEAAHEQKTMIGCLAALLFFLSLMSGGLAAYMLYVLPVIRNFRYLFKAIFVAVPLAVVLLSLAIRESVGRIRQLAVGLTILFTCVGVINAYGTVRVTENLFDMRIEGTFAQEKERATSMTEEAGMDCKNYRSATFFRYSGINDECFDPSRNLTRNFSTALGIFSLSGYEIATDNERLVAFDKIYSNEGSLVKFINAGTLENFYLSLTTEPNELQRQLIDNGVRYLLLDKTELEDNILAKKRKDALLEKDFREEAISSLRELSAIQVADVREFNEHYDLVEISGTNSLCMDEEGNMVPLTDQNMQTITFQVQTAGAYTLSFAYDRNLQAFLTETDGTEHLLSIERLENDNIVISTQDKCGQVTLTYHNPVCTAGFVWEGLVSFIFVVLLIWFYVTKISIPIEKTTELC